MTKKIHKTHFSVTKEVPWKRPITISYIAGKGYRCSFFGCEYSAEYMAEGKLYCVTHWLKSDSDASDKHLEEKG